MAKFRKFFLIGLVSILATLVMLLVACEDTGTTKGGFPESAIASQGVTITVGPANSNADGTTDDVKFQAALDALPSVGGKIVILAGNYSFGSTVSRAIDNVTIEGAGKGSYIAYDGSSPVFDAGSRSGWVFRDFSTDAGGINVSSATNWLISNVWVGSDFTVLQTDTGKIRVPNNTYVFQARDALGTTWYDLIKFDSSDRIIFGSPVTLGGTIDVGGSIWTGEFTLNNGEWTGLGADSQVRMIPSDATAVDITVNSPALSFRTKRWTGAASDYADFVLGAVQTSTVLGSQLLHLRSLDFNEDCSVWVVDKTGTITNTGGFKSSKTLYAVHTTQEWDGDPTYSQIVLDSPAADAVNTMRQSGGLTFASKRWNLGFNANGAFTFGTRVYSTGVDGFFLELRVDDYEEGVRNAWQIDRFGRFTNFAPGASVFKTTAEWGGGYTGQVHLDSPDATAEDTTVNSGAIAFSSRRWIAGGSRVGAIAVGINAYGTNSDNQFRLVWRSDSWDGGVGWDVLYLYPTRNLQFGGAGTFSTVAGDLTLAPEGNLVVGANQTFGADKKMTFAPSAADIDSILPATDARGNIGNASYRWNLVRAVTITSGDLKFENGWYFRETEKGMGLFRPDGSLSQSWE